MNTKNTLRPQRLVKIAQGVTALGALLGSQWALAVNDLPGGPAVNQIDLHRRPHASRPTRCRCTTSCWSSAW
jgi:hypothetical protein